MREFCRIFLQRLLSLFGTSRLEKDLEAELRSHLEMAIDRNLRMGMTPENARRQAHLDLGGLEQTKDVYRDQRGLPLIETAIQDFRFGLRILRRSPGFSTLAILCLTLGIGANAAVFSWIEGVLFRPFPMVKHQERMFAVTSTLRGVPGHDDVSWPDFLDLQKNCTLVDSFIAEKIAGTTLNVGDRAERATGSVVSANYFEALGIRPILGRAFEPSENIGRNAHPVTVISYEMWQNRFRGDPAIVGKTQLMNGVRHTIIGVAPEGFYGTFVGYSFQFWVPASMQETLEGGSYKLEDRDARWIEGFVIVKPGVTQQQAQQEMSAVATRLEVAYPQSNRGRGVELYPLWLTPFNGARTLGPTLAISLVVVVFVLLIACANVGNLLLVRSFARRHEMTVRVAVGAGRGRLVKQLLMEGLILSTFAAFGGLMMAYLSRHWLIRLMPWRGVPVYLSGELDWRVFAFCGLICIVSTLLFTLVPAIQSRKVDLAAALKSDSASVVGARGRAWLRSTLVLVQVSLSFLLLVGAVIVLKDIRQVQTASPGFSTDHLVTTAVNLFASGYDAKKAQTFQDELMTRVRALPGVDNAAYARIITFSLRDYSSAPIAVDGYQAPPDQQPTASYNEISPHYFATIGLPLLSGREFTDSDDENGALVAIVNQPMVDLYWHGEDPVGKRLQVKGRWMQIVGVAKLAKYRNFLETPKPFFYVPLRQNPSPQVGLNIRTSMPPQTIAAALAHEVHALDPEMAFYEVIPMREQLDRSTSSLRVAGKLLTVFGGLALILSAIGLYGVMSSLVSQSTRELGLRMVLGAREADLLRLVLSHGMALTGAGLLLGAAAALALTRLLGYLLYKVSPRDPPAFLLAFAIMAVTALIACLLPARRAIRTDPARVLRD